MHGTPQEPPATLSGAALAPSDPGTAMTTAAALGVAAQGAPPASAGPATAARDAAGSGAEPILWSPPSAQGPGQVAWPQGGSCTAGAAEAGWPRPGSQVPTGSPAAGSNADGKLPELPKDLHGGGVLRNLPGDAADAECASAPERLLLLLRTVLR
ncbi:hypothetical protein COO60DRAFT_1650417 [Scenedesmus sp. NREL 46B-D3]|nr:hypothetical protein COO60DRAFT_1650417 [Scenedesmus sp. NREL 46B-D3]